MDTANMILQELRELRKAVNDGFREHGERLAKLETGMKSLVGNGQPGKVQQIEGDIEAIRSRVNNLEGSRKWMIGYTTLLTTIGAAILALHDHILRLFTGK